MKLPYTVSDIFHYKKSFDLKHEEETKMSYRNQIIGGLGCAFVHVTIGVLFGFTATTLPGMMNPPLDDPLTLTEEQATIFVSGMTLGALVGSLLSSSLLFYLGQRKLMLLCLSCQTAWWILMSRANSFWLLAMCRVSQGITNGMLEGASLTYATEISHPSIRGRLVGSLDMLRQVGYIFIYLIGSLMNWRNAALVVGISGPAIPFLIMLFMADSPRWLASKRRLDEAETSLAFFRGNKYNISAEHAEIAEEFKNSSKNLTIADQAKLLKNRSLLKIFLVLIMLNFLCHFTGSTAIQSYSVLIFSSAPINIDAYLITIIAGCARLVGNFIFFPLSDRYGRRPLFLISTLFSLLFIGLLGTYFHYQDVLKDVEYIGWAPVICTIMYNIMYSNATSSLSGMRSELLPTQFRSLGIGIIFTGNAIGGFTVGMTFFSLTNSFGLAGTFWTYASLGLIESLLVFVFIPETRGRTLEDINVMKTKQ